MELLERDSSLAALIDARADAADGTGSVVLVTGEAGIGKTALVTAFVTTLAADARVLFGTCDDLSVPRPYGPFRDLTGPAAITLHEALQRGAAPHEVHGALLDELRVEPSPTVLVIEDVHWADEATLDAITVVGRRIASLPAVLILTYREGEVDRSHPLNAAVGGLRVEPARHLRLAPLSRSAVIAMAGSEGDHVYAATGGNPFFVTELITARPAELPPSVANAVVGRASRLDAAAQRLVELVSMVPSRISTAVLDAVMPNWPAAAEEPERRNLLQVAARHVRFRHELARVAIRSSVPVARRRLLHAEILDVLLATGAHPADIVHHAEQAGDDDVVADHALLAARQAATMHSNREAYAHYRRASEFADRLTLADRAALFEELAVIAYTVDRLEEAFEAIDRAIALNVESSDPIGEGRCHRLLSRFHWYAGDGERARITGCAAVQLLEPLGPSLELARAYSGLSQLAMLAAEDEQALDWGDRALRLAEQLGDDRLRAHALINIGVCRTNADPDDIGALRDGFSIADAAGDGHEAVRALIDLAWVGLPWVRPDEAAYYTAQGIEYADEHQVDTLLAYLHATSAWLQLRAGDWSEAEAVARKEVEKGVTVGQAVAQTVLVELAVRRGDVDAAARLADVARQADRTGELQRVEPVIELEVEWALTRGSQYPRRRLERLVNDLTPGQRDSIWGARLAAWAAIAGVHCDFQGRFPEPHEAMAAGAYAAAAQSFGAAGWPYDRALMLSLVDGEDELAEALEIARGLGAAPLIARVTRRMRELGITVPRGPLDTTRANPAGLTSRQFEVLALLADGLTNAEIADRLCVSPRTAEHHVEAIFAKLGVSARREAARRYAELTGGQPPTTGALGRDRHRRSVATPK